MSFTVTVMMSVIKELSGLTIMLGVSALKEKNSSKTKIDVNLPLSMNAQEPGENGTTNVKCFLMNVKMVVKSVKPSLVEKTIGMMTPGTTPGADNAMKDYLSTKVNA